MVVLAKNSILGRGEESIFAEFGLVVFWIQRANKVRDARKLLLEISPPTMI